MLRGWNFVAWARWTKQIPGSFLGVPGMCSGEQVNSGEDLLDCATVFQESVRRTILCTHTIVLCVCSTLSRDGQGNAFVEFQWGPLGIVIVAVGWRCDGGSSGKEEDAYSWMEERKDMGNECEGRESILTSFVAVATAGCCFSRPTLRLGDGVVAVTPPTERRRRRKRKRRGAFLQRNLREERRRERKKEKEDLDRDRRRLKKERREQRGGGGGEPLGRFARPHSLPVPSGSPGAGGGTTTQRETGSLHHQVRSTRGQTQEAEQVSRNCV